MLLEKRIPLSFILHKIRFDLPFVLVFSIAVNLIDTYGLHIKLPIGIPTFLGTAISLVLSFKLAQSYDRWWEARKIWGAIVNDCRSVVMQLINFTTDGNDSRNTVQRMAWRQIAWCYTLARSLRKAEPLQDVSKLLSQKESDTLRAEQNIPMTLIHFQLDDLKNLHKQKQLNDFQQIQVDSSFVRLVASMGKAERIKNTVFPKTYRIFLHFFIYVFLFTLSVALADMNSFIEVPLLALISIPFFLLEKTAFRMQDPFEDQPSDTAMLAISRTIEINIRQLLGETELPEPASAEKFYLM